MWNYLYLQVVVNGLVISVNSSLVPGGVNVFKNILFIYFLRLKSVVFLELMKSKLLDHVNWSGLSFVLC